MPKKNKNKGGGIRKAIKAAGPNISRSEMRDITKAAGGNVRKAVNQVSKAGANLASGAANMLIKQATKAPATRYDPRGPFGTSRLAQTLQGMVGTPSTPGRRTREGLGPSTPGTPMQTLAGGMVIRPGGRVAVKKRPTAAAGTTSTQTTEPTTETELVANNPYQEAIDALLGRISGLEETISFNDQYMQDYINQATLAAQQQAADMSAMFNEQLAAQESAYQQTLQQQNLLAQQEQEAARAFMINQARGVSPANLQIGATYGTPKLAGTQGFKYQTKPPAATPTAFTAPTLAAQTAMTVPQQPTVLNV